MPNRIPDETREAIREEVKKGKSLREVGGEFGIVGSTVLKIVKEETKKGSPSQSFDPSNPMVRSDVARMIRKSRKGLTSKYLAKRVHTNIENIRKVLQYLSHHDGYNIVPEDDKWKLVDVLPPTKPLKLETLLGEEFQFGVISDKHMASKYCRLDVLEAAYDIFAERGIKTVLDAGNIIDGEFRYNVYEILTHGSHNQAQYVADNHPQRKGITTYFITGECHEGWYQSREGIKIGWYIQKVCEDAGRDDIKWIGHIESDIVLNQSIGNTRIRLMHPGGGSAYALSYPSQKMVESFQGGEKPHILVLGHYHKFDVNYSREVVVIQPGTVQDQTPYMRKMRLAAHVGFCICKIGMRPDGVIGRCNVEFFPFYDRRYHQKLNQYTLKGDK